MASRARSPRRARSPSAEPRRGRSRTPKRIASSISTPDRVRQEKSRGTGGIWELAQGHTGVPRATQKIGEALFLLLNSIAAIGIIMVNKKLTKPEHDGGFGFTDLNATLTFFHFCCTTFVMLVASRWGLVKKRSFPSKQLWLGVLLAFVAAFAPMVSNHSLQKNSTATYQLAKIAQTPLLATVEVLLGSRSLGLGQIFSLTGVLSGVVVAEVDMTGGGRPAGPPGNGIIFAAAAVCLASTLKILTSKFVKQGWSPAELLWTVYPWATVLLGVCAYLTEGERAVAFARELHAAGGPSWGALAALALSGCFAFLVTMSQVIVVGTMSALSHSLLAQFKTASVILGGALLHREHPHMRQLGGAATAMACLVLYAFLTVNPPPPPPLVLSGHAASLTPY